MSKKNFDSFWAIPKSKLKQSGRTIGSKFQVNSYLIGQLEKNYSKSSGNCNYHISGTELLTLAYDQVVMSRLLLKVSMFWIEWRYRLFKDFLPRFDLINTWLWIRKRFESHAYKITEKQLKKIQLFLIIKFNFQGDTQ